MITINENILQKANKILNEEKQELEKELVEKRLKKYTKTCIKARICPICGEPLIERKPTNEEKQNSFYDHISYVLYCEKSNFIHIEGWDYDHDDD